MSKITKTISFVLTVMMLMLVSGCGGSGGGGFFKGKTETIETYNFRSGTEGVAIKFMEGMPPQKVFVGTDFTTGLRIKNMGAYDIKDKADIKISVPDRSAFDFASGESLPFTLTGKSLYVKEGEENVLMFPMKAKCFPGYDGTRASIVQNYSRKMKATACYYYETTANVDLCVDTLKFNRQKGEKVVCDMQDVKLSGGQGGPVGVASISPTIIPRGESTTLQLGISVKKLQGLDHMIFNPNTQCDIKGQNEVQIEVQLGKDIIKCEPSLVKLKEKDEVGTLCKLEMSPNLGAFKTPLRATMKYYVQQSILQDIRIEPPPGGVNCAALSSAKP